MFAHLQLNTQLKPEGFESNLISDGMSTWKGAYATAHVTIARKPIQNSKAHSELESIHNKSNP